jgi:hypothetical protein
MGPRAPAILLTNIAANGATAFLVIYWPWPSG